MTSKTPMSDLLTAAADLITQSYERGLEVGHRRALAVLRGIEDGTRRYNEAEVDIIKKAIEILEREAPTEEP